MKQSDLTECFVSPNVPDANCESANMVDVLWALSKSVKYAAHHLGTNNATPMGAIELLSKEVMEGTTRIAYALNRLADAVENHQ